MGDESLNTTAVSNHYNAPNAGMIPKLPFLNNICLGNIYLYSLSRSGLEVQLETVAKMHLAANVLWIITALKCFNGIL